MKTPMDAEDAGNFQANLSTSSPTVHKYIIKSEWGLTSNAVLT